MVMTSGCIYMLIAYSIDDERHVYWSIIPIYKKNTNNNNNNNSNNNCLVKASFCDEHSFRFRRMEVAVDKVNFDDAKQYCKDIVLGERTKPQGNDKSKNRLILWLG